ncbi:4201_t:CDS:2 [Cetraspora pellucida]|uniref:4201_t:CDS:1 n=1 Tax=Cetraspora pellucida TaxID=1433469 RepID=A0ACA9NUQ4_9GLOM|nr:4201_t:CDS:2 [Cetraspora pellucida]
MSTILANAWVEITDPNTNDIFYANPQTGECAWEKPSNMVLHQKDPTGEWISIALTPSDDEIDINQIQQINGLRHANMVSPERSSGLLSINYVLSKHNSTSSLASSSSVIKSLSQEQLDPVRNENDDVMDSSNQETSQLEVSNNSTLNKENPINEDIIGSSSQNFSIDKYGASNSSDIPSQDSELIPIRRNSKISQISIDSVMSVSTASTSRPKTPNSGNIPSSGNQLFKIMSPKKSSEAAERARKTGISNPRVNYGVWEIFL